MCMLLAMNTAGFQLIPVAVLAILVGTGYKTTLYDPLVDKEEVKNEYGIHVEDDAKVLDKVYDIVVIGTHHKIFDNINMNKLLSAKGFMCDIYGVHKARKA